MKDRPTARPELKAGDVVLLPGDLALPAKDRDVRAVVELNLYGEDYHGACIGASAHRPLDGSYVSCSGGPIPPFFEHELEWLGWTEQKFWHWKDRPRAGGGQEYWETVSLWRLVR